jgi:cation transport ATPase
LVDGWRSLRAGGPNMNTLVSLGALASFGMSTVRGCTSRRPIAPESAWFWAP